MNNDIVSRLTARVPKTVRQFATLLSGTGSASLLHLLSFALVARSLGPKEFGALTLVRSFAAVVAALASFQSALAIIKYGSEALAAGKPEQVGPLVAWGILVDAVSGLLGLLFGALLIWTLGMQVGIQPESRTAVTIYLITVPFMVQSSPNAVLRLFERFRVFALVHLSIAALSALLIGAITLSRYGTGGVYPYLLVYLGGEILSTAALFYAAYATLAARGINCFRYVKLSTLRESWPGIVRFLLLTNAQGTVKQVTHEADVFIIASMLGTTNTGLYKVAKQLGSASSKVLEPLYQVVYPVFARQAAVRDYSRLVRAIVQLGAFAGGVTSSVWLTFYLFAEDILRLAVGPNYIAAAGVTIWYLAALIVLHGSFGLSRTLLAIGRPGMWLAITLPSSIVYILTLPSAIQSFGVKGAGIAYLWYQALLACLMAMAVRAFLRALRRDEVAGAPLASQAEHL